MKTLKIIIENDLDRRIELFYNESDSKLNQCVDYEFQVEANFKPFDHTYKINGKYYSPCRLDLKQYILVVEEFEIKGSKEDETFKNVLTCPICGYIYHDCWEFSRDFADELECPMCKSILEYEREYKVAYTTKVKKITEPYRLEV